MTAPVWGDKKPITTILLLAAAGCISGCDGTALPGTRIGESVPGGDVQRGIALIRSYGCGTCHTIPGIQGATGLVGPPLYFFSRRTMIAGMLPNTPDNVVAWPVSKHGVRAGCHHRRAEMEMHAQHRSIVSGGLRVAMS